MSSAARWPVDRISSTIAPGGIGGRQAPEEKIAPAQHDHQHVVEVVGHTAGEQAYRLHLARLGELIMGLGQLVEGPLRLLVEAAVLERDGGLGGEDGGELHVVRAEPLFARGADREHAHHLGARLDGHAEERAQAEAAIAVTMGGDQPRIVDGSAPPEARRGRPRDR